MKIFSTTILIMCMAILPSTFMCASTSVDNTQALECSKIPELLEEPMVHDPVAIMCDGMVYLYSTGMGISAMRSADMNKWEMLPCVFNAPMPWAQEAVNAFRGHIWAPDISYYNGKYYLFYSVSTFGKRTSAIGVATADEINPDSENYGWTDHGMVLRSYEGGIWNAIDPNVIFDENGVGWMVFGSWWDGIRLVKLRPDLLGIAQPEEWAELCSRSRDDNGRYMGNVGDGVEAPFLFRKDGYYYLFVSFDRCCAGAKSTYKVAVGRSKDIKGPYLDEYGLDMLAGGGSIVVAGNERYPGVGHQAVYTMDGRDLLFFHGYDMSADGKSKLLIREIRWENGWPRVDL